MNPRVSLLGTGIMGAGMAERLLDRRRPPRGWRSGAPQHTAKPPTRFGWLTLL